MKPIIFSTAEVKKILNGNKVQFRKPVKHQPRQPIPLGFISDSTDIKRIGCYGWGVDELGGVLSIAKPPYRTGDILYVKESWRYGAGRGTSTYEYKIYMTEKELEEEREEYELGILSWKSPVTMPREAARYFLKIKDVRVQKLQKITDSEVIAEGVNKFIQFVSLWNKTYGKQGYGWDKEPWVWVFEFERVEKE